MLNKVKVFVGKFVTFDFDACLWVDGCKDFWISGRVCRVWGPEGFDVDGLLFWILKVE